MLKVRQTISRLFVKNWSHRSGKLLSVRALCLMAPSLRMPTRRMKVMMKVSSSERCELRRWARASRGTGTTRRRQAAKPRPQRLAMRLAAEVVLLLMLFQCHPPQHWRSRSQRTPARRWPSPQSRPPLRSASCSWGGCQPPWPTPSFGSWPSSSARCVPRGCWRSRGGPASPSASRSSSFAALRVHRERRVAAMASPCSQHGW
mmetsp:Transcript_86083/g.278068  ORF Transcript_86083/g.278068 Transcript_86083/m.278068 type:complete len:203 (-) Transcript_86083:457-1065(-)